MTLTDLRLLRVLLDPRVSATPLKVLAELRRRGHRRLPGPVEQEIQRGRPHRQTLDFLRQWLDGEQLTRHRGQWVINSFLPPFPGPAFQRMFTNLLSGRRLSPVSAYLAVTARCPYDCWHCSLKQRPAGELPGSLWESAILQLHELGVSLIGFTGGEPLLRDDLPDLVRLAADGGAATIVFTSGAGWSDALAAELRDAGLWGLCVSLDSPAPAEHDRQRGRPGAFGQAVTALRGAVAAGFYTMAGAVATPGFVDRQVFRELHAFLGPLGVHELRLVETMPCGRLFDADPHCLLSPAHIAELRRFHQETNRLGQSPKVCAFNQIESPEVFGCGGGTQHLFIDSAGNACPCDFTPLGFGNLAGQPLAEIWERMTAAMGNPRRHCFVRHHCRLIAERAGSCGYPLPPEESEKLCAEVGTEPLPDYFQAVCPPSSATTPPGGPP